ncbi:MAG: sensor histidine kinase [Burkholderiales bacterium]
MSLTIRARLALWYAAVLGLALAGSGLASYYGYSRARVAELAELLARADALAAGAMNTELGEGLPLAEAAHDALEDLELPGRGLALFAPDGTHLFGPWHGLPEVNGDGVSDTGPAITTVEGAGLRFRLWRARHRHGNTAYLVGAAESLASFDAERAGLRRALLGGGLAALALATAGGLWIARRALRPLARMAVDARGITEHTPGARLQAPATRDELGVLGDAFNELLGRLEGALAQQRRFMADASHELRTPVSVARTAIEVGLARSGRPEAEYRDSLRVVEGQIQRLSRLVEDMFTLARADAGPLPLEPAPLYLDELVDGCAEDARLVAAPKGVEVRTSAPDDVEAVGDERRLRQMLANLLDNAVRHTPSGGSVHVELTVRPGAFEIAVSDGGPGVPESECLRIFERFVRLDASRRAADGAGLGLPIARTIAEAHGGSLVLARSDPSGSTFLVRLPIPSHNS